MIYKELIDIGGNIFQLDLMYDGIPEVSSAYIIKDKQNAIIETGASHSIPQILKALDLLEISREDVDWIIVTHIHLDHSGGAGHLLHYLPNAKIIVHPRGARHLIDPTKLIASAKEVYKDSFERIYHPILPVPEEKVVIVTDGMRLGLNSREFLFIDSPGHAKHHLTVYDSKTKGIFCGDAVGMALAPLARMGIEYFVPFTTPTQFNPNVMMGTLSRLANFQPDRLYFTHFGYNDHAQAVIERMKEIIPKYTEIARSAYEQEPTQQAILDALRQYHYGELRGLGVPESHSIFEILETEWELNAQGLFLYLQSEMNVLKMQS